MKELQLAGVIDDDPFHYLTWSGSSQFFFKALQAKGVLSAAVSAKPPSHVERIYQLLNFRPNRDSWRFRYHLDPRLFRQRTKFAIARLANDQFNAVLQVGAWYDMTGRGVPAVSYHDGNLARRLDNPFGYPTVSSSVTKAALKFERSLYERLDLLFPMSQWLADSFVRDFGVPEQKVIPVYAGINMPDVQEFPTKNYESRNILFVGKMFERKGGQYLLEAFAQVKKVLPDATLTIVGPKQEIDIPGVNFAGFISKGDLQGLNRLRQLYLNASVFALPTLYEPFGIAFAEAMAHGVPCVGTNICAVPEIITEGKTGFLVPPRDAATLADRLITILKDPSLAQQMGRAGFEKYRENFRWGAVTDKIVAACQKII